MTVNLVEQVYKCSTAKLSLASIADHSISRDEWFAPNAVAWLGRDGKRISTAAVALPFLLALILALYVS